MSYGVIGTAIFRKAKLFASVSFVALTMAGAVYEPASAATYFASNETELRDAITAANTDGDSSAIIKLTSTFPLSGALLPTPAKPITIDTQGFNTGNLQFSNTGGQTLTLEGSLLGGTGQRGIVILSTTPSVLINNGLIVGGPDGTSTTSTGANLSATTFINNGTVTGGSNSGAGSGGYGFQSQRGTNTTNNGLIQGGSSATGNGAAGVFLGGVAGALNTLTNNGTIRGGNGVNGAVFSGEGVHMRNNGFLINNGTIEGGSNAYGVTVQMVDGTIINSGTIRAGAGMADAIVTSNPASNMILELHAGSNIIGNVVGNTTLSDTLRLGGTGSDTFDVSAIGAAAQYRNFDTFEKTGTSTWLLTGIGTAATDWTIYDGTLLVGDHSAPASVIGDITNFGTLGGSGTIIGDVTSSGTVAPGNSIGTLTITGNYTGNGGTLAIESVLAGDASPTDRLVVTGNTSGTTSVKVTNLGGGGAQTVEGIKIVDVGGTSAGTFSLLGDYVFHGDQAVVGGAYAYRLYQNGVSTPADGDWYLRSALTTDPALPATPLYQPGVPLYEAYPQLLLGLNGLSTLQQRLGDRYWPGDGTAASAKGPDNVWLRTEGTHAGIEPDSSTTVDSYDYDMFKLEGGLDGELYQDRGGRLIGGLTVHYGTISGDIDSLYGNGTIDTTGFGLGATITWYGDNGFYVDAQSQATWYDSDLKSDLVDGAMESGNNGFGYALSLETGRRLAASGPWSITPQAQLVYSSVDFDTFNDRFGARVSLDDGDSLVGRLGVALDREESFQRADGQTARAKIYGIANLYGEFLDGVAVDVSGTGFETRNDPVWAGLTLGGSYIWNDERYQLYGEIAAKSSLKDFGDSYALSGTAGLRVKW
ncbi:autotransporter family protein [Rhizobium sp. CF142]|uniref:autotransporter family protein n=1 Tax=Rhizobium sp. CF142 TaxID=1144314 RepID=UPI00026EF4BA|nr:autotransporter outer membrane beta-barrel domain-containing protein [Rhizobium sp. CF142]EJJ27639.1 outer membrane autotransporter barrel domain-containing protein [Rhizobium sp. CF142]